MAKMNFYRTFFAFGEESIEVDISEEACKPYGFLHGQRVLTPYGQKATIIGVAINPTTNTKELWYEKDGDSEREILYWRPNAKNLQKEGFILLS